MKHHILFQWKNSKQPQKPKDLITKSYDNPLLLPEIAFAVCHYLSGKDLHSLCLSCSSLFPSAVRFLWRFIRIRSIDCFRKFGRTLSSPQTNRMDYPSFVHLFECYFPNNHDINFGLFVLRYFVFPNLRAARILGNVSIADMLPPLLQAAQPHLTDLICRSSMAPDFHAALLGIPPDRLRTLGMWGTNPFQAQGDLVRRHQRTLQRVQLNRADEQVMVALRGCGGLRELWYNTEPPVWDSHRESLTAFCESEAVKGLELLCLRNWIDFQSNHLAAIARGSGENLRCLRIMGSPKFRGAFKIVAERCPNLEVLHTDAVEEVDLELITTYCRRLKELHVHNSIVWSNASLRPLIDIAPSTYTLEVLKLHRFNVDLIFAQRLVTELPRLNEFSPGRPWSQETVKRFLKLLRKQMGKKVFRVGMSGLTIFRMGVDRRESNFEWNAPVEFDEEKNCGDNTRVGLGYV
ncbi:hypothetical protein BC937DRAFT_93818 [Endogone sp. FLAS-F59071]|nr:hypothetical protein BC937DRAFT_93818 [Endogone sp. FLAS-F59071]|eukprot:RUS14444.1 hypothetical protein BC937DRAFT_93818 [Endogone sp. FLAS-F59071]